MTWGRCVNPDGLNTKKDRLVLVMVKHAGNQQQFGMRGGQFWQNHPDARTIGGKLLAQWTEILRFVPVQLVQIQHEPAFAARQ